MPATKKLLLTAATVTALATGAGVAVAQDPAPTTVTVGQSTQLKAPAKAPFDAPGVRAIRRGKPLPSRYVLVGRKVTIQIGQEAAWGAARFTCPKGKVLKTAGFTGHVAPQMLDHYVGKKTTRILFDSLHKQGTYTGTVYAVCG